MDIQALKDRIDLREWVERDLGRAPVQHGSGERPWAFKCPFHNEHKGASLIVYRTHWRCYGACGESGDILNWIAKRNQLQLTNRADFRRILTELGADPDDLTATRPPPTPRAPPPPVAAQPPSAAWQAAATNLVERAQRHLWSKAGHEALDYLMHRRGMHEQTIREASLGYIPANGKHWRVEGKLLIPAHSISLPWFAGGVLWGVKCRRLAGDEPRYLQFTTADKYEADVGKGNLDGALYWVDRVVPRAPVLIVEGEFNCLSAWEAAQTLVCPVSVGTSGQALNVRWLAKLATAPAILAWFDADRAGRGGAERLVELARYIQPLTLPDGVGKDLNDFWCASQSQNDRGAVQRWLNTALSQK